MELGVEKRSPLARKEDVRHQLAQELKATIAEHEQDGYSAHKMKTAAPKQQSTPGRTTFTTTSSPEPRSLAPCT